MERQSFKFVHQAASCPLVMKSARRYDFIEPELERPRKTAGLEGTHGLSTPVVIRWRDSMRKSLIIYKCRKLFIRSDLFLQKLVRRMSCQWQSKLLQQHDLYFQVHSLEKEPNSNEYW